MKAVALHGQTCKWLHLSQVERAYWSQESGSDRNFCPKFFNVPLNVPDVFLIKLATSSPVDFYGANLLPIYQSIPALPWQM